MDIYNIADACAYVRTQACAQTYTHAYARTHKHSLNYSNVRVTGTQIQQRLESHPEAFPNALSPACLSDRSIDRSLVRPPRNTSLSLADSAGSRKSRPRCRRARMSPGTSLLFPRLKREGSEAEGRDNPALVDSHMCIRLHTCMHVCMCIYTKKEEQRALETDRRIKRGRKRKAEGKEDKRGRLR